MSTHQTASAAEDAPTSVEAGGPLLSLIMATYGRTAELMPAIASLVAQTDRTFELIVVDQNKDERIAPLLEPARKAGLEVQHVRQTIPNLSAARNAGMKVARGEVVAFPDDDCWYEPEVVARVRSRLIAKPALDGVVARWVEIDPALRRPAGALSGEAWRRFRGGDATSFTLFLKPARIRELGGFDPRLGTGRWFGAGEETDLILRMLTAGHQIDYVPAAGIHHWHADWPEATRAQIKRQRSYARGTGAIYVKHKVPPAIVLRGIAAPLAKALTAPRPLQALLLGALTSLGRIEGMIGWSLGPGRQPRPPEAT